MDLTFEYYKHEGMILLDNLKMTMENSRKLRKDSKLISKYVLFFYKLANWRLINTIGVRI